MARAPTTVATMAPISPARSAGAASSQARSLSRRATASASEDGHQRQEDEGERLQRGCARRGAGGARRRRRDRRRPPASSTERVRWALAPESRSTRASRASATNGAATTSSAARRRRAAIAAAAAAAPTGITIAAPTSAPKRPAAKTKAATRPIAEEGARPTTRRQAGREPGQPGPGAGDDQDRQRRLELVADPVEANPQAGIGAHQRERRQRRAGDHVGRAGEHRQRRGQRQRPVAVEQRQGQRRQRRRAQQHQQHFHRLPRLDRGADQQHQRHVDDRQADEPAPRCAPPLRAAGRRRAQAPRPRSAGSTRSPARAGPEITAIRAPSASTAAGSTSPSARIGCARHLRRNFQPEVIEDRRRDIGREHVAVEPGAVGGQVAVDSPCPRSRSPAAHPNRSAGDGDRPDPRDAVPPAAPASAVEKRRRSESAEADRPFAHSRPATEGARAGPWKKTATPCAVRPPGSRPGSISAGADSARFAAASYRPITAAPAAAAASSRRASRRPGCPARRRGRSAAPAPLRARRRAAPATSRPGPDRTPKSPAAARRGWPVERVRIRWRTPGPSTRRALS